jgi:hypothetical protein
MAMREGYRGEDMFKEKCFDNGVAAITYIPIQQTDLGQYSPKKRPPRWNQLAASQKGSISKFAWQIRSGDTLYVRDSAQPNLLIGCGLILGDEGKLGYAYKDNSPIRTESGEVWRHLLKVDWQYPFQKIPYKDHSANTTVLALDEEEVATFKRDAKKLDYKQHGLSNVDVDLAVGLEEAYPRATPATVRMILPKHRFLSKQFQRWLASKHRISSHAERRQIDMEFNLGQMPAMAEFKIAYDGNTKAAMREALGQILEYNHYPGRKLTAAWFLVLDQKPCEDDRRFVNSLRASWRCPIYLGWQHRTGFSFFPESPLG